ncbi:hypothetical protein B0H10DRAFT_1970158 [Mycena sp. CBHHK59/15]|nr:hypothetical protein B0H10DRAFT_1970158 [Mycena sp. CBHHK59/15]
MPRVDRCDRLSPTAEKSELVGAAPGQGKGVSAHFRALGMTDFSTSGETVGAAHRGQAFATGESAPSDQVFALEGLIGDADGGPSSRGPILWAYEMGPKSGHQIVMRTKVGKKTVHGNDRNEEIGSDLYRH